MERAGLERLFRLLTEPRRLWKHYLINNPVYVMLAIEQLMGILQFPADAER